MGRGPALHDGVIGALPRGSSPDFLQAHARKVYSVKKFVIVVLRNSESALLVLDAPRCP